MLPLLNCLPNYPVGVFDLSPFVGGAPPNHVNLGLPH